jgi:hypothetical protein
MDTKRADNRGSWRCDLVDKYCGGQVDEESSERVEMKRRTLSIVGRRQWERPTKRTTGGRESKGRKNQNKRWRETKKSAESFQADRCNRSQEMDAVQSGRPVSWSGGQKRVRVEALESGKWGAGVDFPWMETGLECRSSERLRVLDRPKRTDPPSQSADLGLAVSNLGDRSSSLFAKSQCDQKG